MTEEETVATGTAESEPEASGPNGPNGSTDDREHLDGLEPGAGCAEIWEHLSERRERTGSD
jgi:hypothetical protein